MKLSTCQNVLNAGIFSRMSTWHVLVNKDESITDGILLGNFRVVSQKQWYETRKL